MATKTDACHSPMCDHPFPVREEICRKEINEEGDISCCSVWRFMHEKTSILRTKRELLTVYRVHIDAVASVFGST